MAGAAIARKNKGSQQARIGMNQDRAAADFQQIDSGLEQIPTAQLFLNLSC
jgi:hypothetical protein